MVTEKTIKTLLAQPRWRNRLAGDFYEARRSELSSIIEPRLFSINSATQRLHVRPNRSRLP